MVNIFRNDGLKNVKCFVNLKYKKEISVFLQDPFRSSIAMCDTDYWYWSLHLILHAEWWLFNNMVDMYDLAVVVGNIVRILLLQALVLIVLDQVNSVMISYQVDACSIVRAARAPQLTRGARNEPARPILRYESSTLILYKELSSHIFPLWVSQASVTPVQISTLCNI